MVSVITSKDGTQIAYEQRGDRPAVLVVDGTLSTRMSGSEAELVDVLALTLSVDCYDRRGRGDSGDTLPYTVEREIEDIAALIDEAGASPPSTVIRRVGASLSRRREPSAFWGSQVATGRGEAGRRQHPTRPDGMLVALPGPPERRL